MDRLGLGTTALNAANRGSFVARSWASARRVRIAADRLTTPSAWRLSGIASLLLDPENPQACGPTIPDNATGMFACYGILGALYDRERTGLGRRVEVNMLEAAISFIPDPFANYTQNGTKNDPLTRVASSHSFAFRCADGKLLAIHLSSQPKFWEGLLTAIKRLDLGVDPRFSSRELRIKNFVPLTRALGEVIAKKPRAEWMMLLEANDVPFAPVHKIEDVLDDPQVEHLQTFRTLQHPTEAHSPQSAAPFISMADATAPICRRPRSASIPTRCSRSSATTTRPSRKCARRKRSSDDPRGA